MRRLASPALVVALTIFLVLLLAPRVVTAQTPSGAAAEPCVRPQSGPDLPPGVVIPPPSGTISGDSPLAEFTPRVDEIVAAVSLQSTIANISQLSGYVPILVGGTPETLATRYTHSPLANVAGAWLQERFERMGYEVELQWFTHSGSTVANVIATRTGSVRPDDVYVIGAHYDCVSQMSLSDAPGANDNASGTAVVLEAARVLAPYETEATVQFVCFAAEEQGLIGSYVFVDRAMAAGTNIIGAITLDMISYWNSSYAIQIEGGVPWEWLMDVMAASCDRYTDLGWQKTWYSWGSDHVPFQDAGIPAFLAIEDDWDAYSCYHRICDTFPIQDSDITFDVARAAVGALASLAGVLSATGVAEEEGALAGAPDRSAGLVLRVSPRPIAGAATILLDLPSSTDVELALYDVAGRRLMELERGAFPAGRRETRWIAPPSLPDGVYFLSARSATDAAVTRVILRR